MCAIDSNDQNGTQTDPFSRWFSLNSFNWVGCMVGEEGDVPSATLFTHLDDIGRLFTGLDECSEHSLEREVFGGAEKDFFKLYLLGTHPPLRISDMVCGLDRWHLPLHCHFAIPSSSAPME